jgi:hypothetical protein
MRADMAKIIVERPRGGGRATGKRHRLHTRLLRDMEAESNIAPMWKHSGGDKWFSDNLNPLYRYVDRQVGRPWNKVYSEIAGHISPGNTVQAHVLVHLWQHVERHVVEKDGRVEHSPSYWGGHELRDRQLYVCPRTGLLKAYRRRPKLKPVDVVPASSDRAFRRHRGRWVEVFYSWASNPDRERPVDALTGKPVWTASERTFAMGGGHVEKRQYASYVRPLSEKERHRRGLPKGG